MLGNSNWDVHKIIYFTQFYFEHKNACLEAIKQAHLLADADKLNIKYDQPSLSICLFNNLYTFNHINIW